MGFILLLLFIVIAFVLAGSLLAITVIRNIFKLAGRAFGMRSSNASGSSNYQTQDPGQSETHTTSFPKSKRKKVFDDDEGEYVEFEEIKES